MRHVFSAAIAVTVTAASLASPCQVTGQQRGLTVTEAATPRSAFGRYRAILFAVGEQAPQSDLPSLRFPISEADSLRSVLIRQYTFDSSDVRVVRNPTGGQIIDALDSLAMVLGPQDNLLVLYSGHGVYDRDGQEGYWQASDANSSRKSTWLANSEVRTVMRKLRARQVLVVTDACFSGALTRGGGSERVGELETFELGARLSRRTSRRAITAGSFDEPVPAASVFAVELAKALRGNRGDIMTAGRLAFMIRPAVASAARTTVQYGSFAGVADEQGEFVFVSRTARPQQASGGRAEERVATAPPRAVTAGAPLAVPQTEPRETRTEARATTSFLGCWRYPTGDLLRMSADGSVSGAALPGRWTAERDGRYVIRWPPYSDALVLSDDGRKLTGINNYKLSARASRNGPSTDDRRSLTGSWAYNGLPAVATADGAIVAGPYKGAWRATGDGTFVIDWTHQPVDDLTIVSEGNELRGSNNLGVMISAARSTCRE